VDWPKLPPEMAATAAVDGKERLARTRVGVFLSDGSEEVIRSQIDAGPLTVMAFEQGWAD